MSAQTLSIEEIVGPLPERPRWDKIWLPLTAGSAVWLGAMSGLSGLEGARDLVQWPAALCLSLMPFDNMQGHSFAGPTRIRVVRLSEKRGRCIGIGFGLVFLTIVFVAPMLAILLGFSSKEFHPNWDMVRGCGALFFAYTTAKWFSGWDFLRVPVDANCSELFAQIRDSAHLDEGLTERARAYAFFVIHHRMKLLLAEPSAPAEEDAPAEETGPAS